MPLESRNGIIAVLWKYGEKFFFIRNLKVFYQYAIMVITLIRAYKTIHCRKKTKQKKNSDLKFQAHKIYTQKT